MKWRQFLTPVKSFNAEEASAFADKQPGDAFTFLDVRQPEEYERNHIPGALLIPLPDLPGRMTELDPEKPTIVYCAIGGRSRMAAQMLAGKGFREIYNLSGGIKAWEGDAAFGPEDLGLALFSGNESPEETLVVAYSLEAGLLDFYLSMIPKMTDETARGLFETLSKIEIKHQQRIFGEYVALTATTLSEEAFAADIVSKAMEGGLTTEEYLRRYQPDFQTPSEIISLAMAIEAQALDLYQRAAQRAATKESRAALQRIADEEREHLRQLGGLFETGRI